MCRLVGIHLLQGVYAVAAHSISAPGVDLGTAGQTIAIDQLALPHIHSDGIHCTIGEDDVGVSIGGGQIAAASINAGQEHILVGLLHQLNADQIAVLVPE